MVPAYGRTQDILERLDLVFQALNVLRISPNVLQVPLQGFDQPGDFVQVDLPVFWFSGRHAKLSSGKSGQARFDKVSRQSGASATGGAAPLREKGKGEREKGPKPGGAVMR
jgi:hypothetical protein